MYVLELFSGIGGMHFALKGCKLNAKVLEAIDINTVANLVYKYNFPEIKLNPKNILSLTPSLVNELEVDMILMSPPCQPYTRLGKKEDTSDRRSDSLSHLINIIPKLDKRLKYILLENVKGFDESESRNRLLNSLKPTFGVIEFLLNPLQFGIPNSRERYYLLARRGGFGSSVTPNKLVTDPSILCEYYECFTVKDILEFTDDSLNYQKYLVPNEILEKRIKVMDIVTKAAKRSCCFTKSYGRYIEGTGSIYCPLDESTITDIIGKLETVSSKEERLEVLRSLRLRFFSPKEVSRLLRFPEEFNFPNDITDRQKYNLLGNSINVKVVSTLIQFLVN